MRSIHTMNRLQFCNGKYCTRFTVKLGFLNLVVKVRRGNESSESPLVPFPFTGVLLCDLPFLEPDFGDTSNGDDVIGRVEAPPTLRSC